MLAGKHILLIISGGIAAYKSLDLIRRLKERGASVTPLLTKGAEEFITPLSASALAGNKAFTDLFDLTSEAEMGHIELSRSADLIIVAPGTADLMAKMAQGAANDLASTVLLATDTRVLLAPAMNVRMWQHPATQRNLSTLVNDGVRVVGPGEGDMACGEFGPGRLSDPLEIVAAAEDMLANGPLKGKKIIVTSGPTHEPIDPVRYIANRSSGTQGTAIAQALSALGAHVVFVTGPAYVPPPAGVEVVAVETADEMLAATLGALPAAAFVGAAAVADWKMAEPNTSKIKKDGAGLPTLSFKENPDILATISAHDQRPELVVGFAAETDNVEENAAKKRDRKGCDWIVANDVSPGTGIMGGAKNAVTILDDNGAESWPMLAKDVVARRLAERIAKALT